MSLRRCGKKWLVEVMRGKGEQQRQAYDKLSHVSELNPELSGRTFVVCASAEPARARMIIGR